MTPIQSDIAILDFSKAFNTVPRHKLFHKLDHYEVRGPLHTRLTNFLTKRKTKIVLEGDASDEAAVDSGVPQCWIQSQYSSFATSINELPDGVKLTVCLFTDDCLLHRGIRNFQDHILLQSDLKQLEEWAKKWGMCFSPQKCYILSTRSKSPYFYSLDRVILKHVLQNPLPRSTDSS